jgi:hypothetical protein
VVAVATKDEVRDKLYDRILAAAEDARYPARLLEKEGTNNE